MSSWFCWQCQGMGSMSWSGSNIYSSHNIHTTIVPVGTSAKEGHYCSSQGSLLSETNDYTSFPVVYLVSSSTMRASQ